MKEKGKGKSLFQFITRKFGVGKLDFENPREK